MDAMAHPTTRPRKTAADYLALPDDVRAELIAGELYVTPAPRPDHQRALQRLFRALAPFAERHERGEVFVAPVDVYLPTGDIVQPDLVLVEAGQSGIVGDDAIHGVPALLVEVLSRSHPERDRIVKRDRYAASGVREYWLVDPDARGVEVFALAERQFEPRGWFTGDAQIVSPSLPGLSLAVASLFP
jgi:Uma2 family endonuclease